MSLFDNVNNYYRNLEESVKNTYRFTVVDKSDNSYFDTVEAYSWKQAKYLASTNHKGCLIRDLHAITDNKEESKSSIDDGEQLSMFESKDKSDIDKNFKSQNNIKYKIIDTDSEEWTNNYSNIFLDIANKANKNLIYALAITDNNKICGIINVKKQAKGKNIIGGFRVYDEYKGNKIGEKLFEYAVNNLGGNYLGVFEDNKIAIHLYNKYGFKEVADKKYTDGDRVIFMERK